MFPRAKLNLTQQKHAAFTNQKKRSTTQNKHPARKWSGSILNGKDEKVKDR